MTDIKTVDEEKAPAPSPPPSEESGVMTIAKYSQLYAVSRNPFGLALILPLLLFAFIALEAGLLAHRSGFLIGDADIPTLVGGFMILTTGLLLIPATVLRGYMTFDDKGVEMRYGKQKLTAGWDQVAGLTYEAQNGVCVLLKGQTQSKPVLKMPGGFRAEQGGEALIPIRFFGDRRFAILYEIRDRVPESAWRHALEQAQPASTKRPLLIYALTVLFAIGCMISVAFAVSR